MEDHKPQEQDNAQQSYLPYQPYSPPPQDSASSSAPYQPYKPFNPSSGPVQSDQTKDSGYLPYRPGQQGSPERKDSPTGSEDKNTLPEALRIHKAPERKASPTGSEDKSPVRETEQAQPEPESKEHYRAFSPEAQQTSAAPEHTEPVVQHEVKTQAPEINVVQPEPEQQYRPLSSETQQVPPAVNDSVPQNVAAPAEVQSQSPETIHTPMEPKEYYQRYEPEPATASTGPEDPADGMYDPPPARPPKIKEHVEVSQAAEAPPEYPPEKRPASGHLEFPLDNKIQLQEPPKEFEEPPPAYHELHPPVKDGAHDGPSEIKEYYPPDIKHTPVEPAEYAQSEDETPPPMPPRPADYRPPLPPRRSYQPIEGDDPGDPIHYTRDPHKLVAYLIPFPKPKLAKVPAEKIPDRFLIYTPPPPPLTKPAEGEKEARVHKIQRKWQEEVRSAKNSTAKAASWQGVRSKATKGIDWAIKQTTSSNLDFVNRMTGSAPNENANAQKAIEQPHDATAQAPDGTEKEKDKDGPSKAVPLTHLTLVYPSSLPYTPAELRSEFINSMLRTQSKAQRDSIIATGLLPVSVVVDTLIMFVWPFGGLFEADAVWAYSSIRGAKIARSTTKRLQATSEADGAVDGTEPADTKDKPAATDKGKAKAKDSDPSLALEFTPSARLAVLQRYLAHRCHERAPALFPYPSGSSPTESEVLEAIAWAPSQSGGATRNWEDERWEMQEVKEDFKGIIGKGAREWEKWCRRFEEDPKKAVKK
ncbi:uncharacterized protein BKA78DRAFT_291291 [Phyllosticta capitalensis]|uniref:uncharacterized protein n=1 Tax=Phyllosticta capitalensis TaxID=121624 RepID=UPI0031302DB7